ncbi:unnamed protein product [Gordionus sp. m RMFG-2023]|uniref:uncharacterized protein LOC135927084 n=1 Tax=Gordionus sp. m RMFG-2023 TaxID=3053472 RepID=UPI0030E2304D
MAVDYSYIYYSINITYGILMSTQIGLGLIGNFVYFWCLFKNRKISNGESSVLPSIPTSSRQVISSRSSTMKPKRNIHLYIKTLAINDFLSCVNSITLPVIYLVCYNTCRRSYHFMSYSLKIGFPFMDAFTNFSYILRVFISLDRLWALEFPFSYRTVMSNSFIKYLMVLGFVVSFSATIPYGWGYIAVKVEENETTPILCNQVFIKSIHPESIDFNLTDAKYRSVKNNSIHCLNKKFMIIKYTHSVNPNTPWFQTYRRWITFIMSFIPFTISSMANIFIIKKCYKISRNRINLKGGNKVAMNERLNSLNKWFNKITNRHRRIHNHNMDSMANLQTQKASPVMKRREFQITILMAALNMHYIFSTIPMTLYMFIYKPWSDTFSNKSELWFQNLAYLSKYGNNALSVYITLFLDPTIKTLFYDILKKYLKF